MENKCSCYHIQKKRRYTYNQFTGEPIGHDVDVGVCWGTKETDECSCGGDETKCDFYPEVRAKARKKEDSLILSFDFSPSNIGDAATLVVERKNGNKIEVINELRNGDALDVYDKLIYG